MQEDWTEAAIRSAIPIEKCYKCGGKMEAFFQEECQEFFIECDHCGFNLFEEAEKFPVRDLDKFIRMYNTDALKWAKWHEKTD